jgi:hypothetical protein
MNFSDSISAISERVCSHPSMTLQTLLSGFKTNQDSFEAVSISYDKYDPSCSALALTSLRTRMSTRSDFIYNQLEASKSETVGDKSEPFSGTKETLNRYAKKDLLTAKRYS